MTPFTSYLILEDEAREGLALNRRVHFGGLRDEDGLAFDAEAPAAPAARDALDSLISSESEEARKFSKEKSGESAVRGAASGSDLKNAKGLADLGKAVGSSYSSNTRGRANNAFESLIIDGKTFHRNGDLWIDDDARDDGKWIECVIESYEVEEEATAEGPTRYFEMHPPEGAAAAP